MTRSRLPFIAPPADAGLPSTTLDLEAAHAELRRAALGLEHDVPPAFDLALAARAMEQAFVALYDACDGRAERLAAVQRAAEELQNAVHALAPGREPSFEVLRVHLEQASAHLGRAEERLARLAPLGGPEPQELLASIDVPRLHVLARPSLAPSLRFPKPPSAGRSPPPALSLPKPKTFPELRAAIAEMKKHTAETRERPSPPPPKDTGKVREAIDDAAFLRSRARECFEEVAMVGMQRAPLLGDPWRGSLLLERRMLASIDVIAAIGLPAIEHIPRLVADAPVKAPSHAFAAAMVLGCIGGRDALAAAEHALLASDREDPFVDAFGAALELAPHDLLPLALRSLLGESDPAIRAMAIEVLGYRGLATADELAAAVMDDPKVAARALLPFAATPSPELAPSLTALAAAEEPALREAVWWAMAMTGHPQMETTLTAALQGPQADKAALVLSIAGDERDARRVVQHALAAPSRELLFAVGWTGDAWAIGQLMELLERREDDELRASAAWALERITGAGMWEQTEVDPEEIDVAEPPAPEVGEPRVPKLARALSDPRDNPPEPVPDTIEQPTTDADRWRAFWREKGSSFNLAARYRRGRPYTPAVSLAELDRARVTPVERRWLQRELVIRTGAFVRFDPHDLVAVQEEALRAWQAPAARASSAPGRWLRPARGR